MDIVRLRRANGLFSETIEFGRNTCGGCWSETFFTRLSCGQSRALVGRCSGPDRPRCSRSKSPSRRSPSNNELREFWMRRTPCGPSAGRPSPSSTPSFNPSSLTCSANPVTNPLGWRVGRLEDYFSKTRAGTCCGPFGSALKKHEYVEDGIPVWASTMSSRITSFRIEASP